MPTTLVESLLDQLPRVPFAAKDCELRYTAANAAMLDLCRVERRTDIVGRTGADFFPDQTRRRHEAAERQVMRTRRPTRDLLDHWPRLRGEPVWLMLSRWPLIGESGAVTGVAVIGRMLDAADRRHPMYVRVATVAEHIHANFGAEVDIEALSQRAGTSLSQLERDFVSLFGVTPRRYLAKVRIEAAIELLIGDDPIVDVAHSCGYADQSAFARRFRAVMGMTPSDYRRACARVEKVTAA